jgi:REP element-mobilizing transposase RayT
MGRSRYKFIYPDQPHFMTLTVLHWIPVFTRPQPVNIVLDSLRYLMAEKLHLYAWVILENHLHLVAQSPSLDRQMARLKSFTARQLLLYLDQVGAQALLDQLAFYRKAHKKADRPLQFWQEGVHPEWIQNEAMLRQKIEYVHHNPVRRGYVDEAEHWRYSSARDYAGVPGLLEITRMW